MQRLHNTRRGRFNNLKMQHGNRIPETLAAEEVPPTGWSTLRVPTDALGPVRLIRLFDPEGDETIGYVVVDNLRRGPALGGIRIATDVTAEEVFRLARAMTLKNAAARLPLGGGKGGLRLDPTTTRAQAAGRRRLMERVAEALYSLVEYIPGPDMGTDEEDMQVLYETFTRMAGAPHHGRGGVGRPPACGGLPLDAWGLTAHGLLAAAYALEAVNPDFRIEGARVIVQGFGAVGAALAAKLCEAGAILVGASDIHAAYYHPEGLDIAALLAARRHPHGLAEYEGRYAVRFGPEELDRLLEMPCLILAPAARPDAITDRNWRHIQARFILEGANTPIPPETERRLWRERGVVCLTDFIVNAGGVIACAVERLMDTDAAFRKRIGANKDHGRAFIERMIARIIGDNVRELADRLAVTPHLSWRDAALAMAHERLIRHQTDAFPPADFLP